MARETSREKKSASISRCSSVTCRDFPKWRACSQATSFLPVRSLILTGECWVVCDRIWKNNLYFSDVTRSTIGIQLMWLCIYIQPWRLSKTNLSELKWTIFSNSFVSLSSNSRLWILGFWSISVLFVHYLPSAKSFIIIIIIITFTSTR